MGLGKWWLTHGSGSPGDCAKAIVMDYLKWKAETPGVSENELLLMVLMTRMSSRQHFGLTFLSHNEAESVVAKIDGSLPELIMYILCYEDDKINNGTQAVYWQIENIVNETVYKYCPKYAERSKCDLNQLISTASSCTDAGDWQGAISAYTMLIKEDPRCADYYFHRGYAFSSLGNYEQAIEDYDNAIVLDPQHTQVFYQKGGACIGLGKLQQAIDCCNKDIELNYKKTKSHASLSYVNRGSVYGYLGNSQQAIKDFNKAIGLDPSNALAYSNRGLIYGTVANYQRAIIDYNKAIELNSQDADAYLNLARAYLIYKDRNMAIPNIIKAAELGDKLANDWLISNNKSGEIGHDNELVSKGMMRGNVEPQGNDFIAAVNKYVSLVIDKTISYVNILEQNLHEDEVINGDLFILPPLQYSQIVVECIMLYAHLSDRRIYGLYGPTMRSKVMHAALPSITKLIKNGTLAQSLPRFEGICTFTEKEEISSFYQKQRKSVDNSLNISMCIFDLDEINARYRDYSTFNLSTDFDMAMYALLDKFSENISKCIYNQPDSFTGKYIQEQALNVALDSQFGVKDDDLEYIPDYLNRGIDCIALGDYRQALNNCNKAIELNAEGAWVYFIRGCIYNKFGDHHEALNDYGNAIKLSPWLADAYVNRGNTYYELGNYDQAIVDYDKAIELTSQDAITYFNRGRAYFNLDAIQEAVKDYDKAIELDSQYAEAYLRRGYAHFNLGNKHQSEKDKDKAAELNSSCKQTAD